MNRTGISVGLMFILISIMGSVTHTSAEMIIRLTDGREVSVQIDRNQIESIRFTQTKEKAETGDTVESENRTFTSETIETGELAETGDESGKIVFEDDFENGLSNWEGNATQQMVIEGVAEFFSKNHTALILNRTIPVENIVVEWRGAANKNGFFGQLGSYHFNIGGWNNTASGYSGPGVAFNRVDTGKVYEPGIFHIWKVVRQGDKWSAFVDDKPIFETTINAREKDGRLSFNSFKSRLQLDWVRIYRP